MVSLNILTHSNLHPVIKLDSLHQEFGKIVVEISHTFPSAIFKFWQNECFVVVLKIIFKLNRIQSNHFITQNIKN